MTKEQKTQLVGMIDSYAKTSKLAGELFSEKLFSAASHEEEHAKEIFKEILTLIDKA
jgi:hypothetical protein